jgi:hypothetical protein
MASTARIAALAAILAVVPACQRSDVGETVALCTDLTNLRATVSELEAPGPNVTVGEVRGDIDKLASTVGTVGGSTAIPDALGDELEDARDAYLDVFDGIGDDDRFSSVATEASAPARRLGGAYDAVVAALACGRSPSPS